MKFLIPIAVILALTSCSITQKVGVGSGNLAVETTQAIKVTTTENGTEKVHLGLSGASDNFKPSVDKIPDPVNAGKLLEAGTCKITEKKLNIWNCDLDVMKPGDIRNISFEGRLLSGNFFAYELKTNKIIIENVKVK